MTPQVLHYTKLFRAESGRPILECYENARRHVHFMKTLSESVRAHKKRSRAAKKAWAKRRAA